jgi:uncharacterized membrane protein
LAGEVTEGKRRPRFQLLDILRGVAILAMIVFHIGWDLYYFGYSNVDVTTEFGWVVFQKAILSSFLLLVGAGLVLGHGDGIRWPSFWRRFGLVAAAALATTAGTYWMFPEFFVFFGVLHAIALFLLAGLAFLRLTPWLTALLGVIVIAANFAWNDPAFSSRELGWIGFWPVSPPTSDVVPIFPWFGVVLLGIAGMRLILAGPLAPRLAGWHSDASPARGLAFLGRWSLLIYVLHQPLIIGVLYALMQLQTPVIAPPVLTMSERFVDACTDSCVATGNTTEFCERLCQCALAEAEPEGLVAIPDLAALTPEQRARLDEIGAQCRVAADAVP